MARDTRANPTNAAGKYHETAEYVKFMRRVARGMGRRTADMDPTALAEFSSLAAELRQVETDAALALNDQGFSWAEIGAAQGITGSVAWRKYAKASGRGASRKDLAPAR
jgi:hypothetical protein